MNKILIATDGSESSAEAVDLGLELAAEQEAAVIFVHVAPVYDLIPIPGFGMTGSAPRVPHPIDELDRAPLEEAEHRAEERGVGASSKLLVGNAADEIVTFADSEDVDLIVIGSRGHGTLASALLGSVSREVLSHSRRPVVIVRARAAVPAASS